MLLNPTGVSTLRVTRGVGLGGTIQLATGVGVGVSSGGSCSYHSEPRFFVCVHLVIVEETTRRVVDEIVRGSVRQPG
jgi:hypothetical protein